MLVAMDRRIGAGAAVMFALAIGVASPAAAVDGDLGEIPAEI
jgi:hypothetical protein